MALLKIADRVTLNPQIAAHNLPLWPLLDDNQASADSGADSAGRRGGPLGYYPP